MSTRAHNDKFVGLRKVAAVILPTGTPLIPDQLGDFIAQRFGGYHSYATYGAWTDGDGKVVKELGMKFEIAMIDTNFNRNQLHEVVTIIKTKGQQEAVYVQWPNGDVTIE